MDEREDLAPRTMMILVNEERGGGVVGVARARRDTLWYNKEVRAMERERLRQG